MTEFISSFLEKQTSAEIRMFVPGSEHNCVELASVRSRLRWHPIEAHTRTAEAYTISRLSRRRIASNSTEAPEWNDAIS